MKKFWFFDLDGTLADTERDIRESWKLALDDLGLECPDFDKKYVTGPQLGEMVRLLFPDRATPELTEQIRIGFSRHYDRDGFPNTREYPDVLDAVRRLKAGGATVAIVTNKRYVAACAMARHFGWESLFDGIYAGDMYRETPIGTLRKPELLKHVMEKHGAKPDDSVLVGDTRNDFEAAEKNGVLSIGVAWGYGTEEERAAAGKVVTEPSELPALNGLTA